jgi:hypothetical protein
MALEHLVHVRVTDAQWCAARDAAKALGLRLSEYIRLCLYLPPERSEGEFVSALYSTADFTKLFRELNRWGVNLNQIAHATNAIILSLDKHNKALSEDDRLYLRSKATATAEAASGIVDGIAAIAQRLSLLAQKTAVELPRGLVEKLQHATEAEDVDA